MSPPQYHISYAGSPVKELPPPQRPPPRSLFRDRYSIPRAPWEGPRSYLFFKTSTRALGPTQWVPMGAVSPRGKTAMGAANHSPPSSAEVKKKWIYISTSQWSYNFAHTCDYMRCEETTLPLPYSQNSYSTSH